MKRVQKFGLIVGFSTVPGAKRPQFDPPVPEGHTHQWVVDTRITGEESFSWMK